MSDQPLTFVPDEHNQDPVNQLLTDAGRRATTALNGAVYTKLLMDQWRLRKARQELDDFQMGDDRDLSVDIPPPPALPRPPGDQDRYAFAESLTSPAWDRDLQRRLDVLSAASGSVVGHPLSDDEGLLVGPLRPDGRVEVAMLSDNPPGRSGRTKEDLVTNVVRYDELVLLDNLGLGTADLRREDPAYDELARLHPDALARYEGLAARSDADIALGRVNDTFVAIAQADAGDDLTLRGDLLGQADAVDGRADTLRASPVPGPPPMPPADYAIRAGGAYLSSGPDPSKLHGRTRRGAAGSTRHRRNGPGDEPRFRPGL